MNLTELRAKTRWITRSDATSFADADLDRELNSAYRQTAILILQAQGYRNQFGKHSYTDLIDNTGLVEGDNGYQGQYSFPTNLLKPHRVEVKFSADSTPKLATVYDLSENTLFSEQSDDDLTEMAHQDNPIVRFNNDSLFIRPLNTSGANITNGIHIWYEYRQDEMDTGTDVPNFEESFHEILCYFAALEFYVRYPDKYNRKAEQRLNELKRDLAKFYRARMSYKKTITPSAESFK